MSEQFLTVEQVAGRLVIAKSTARQWMREGKLPAIKLPGQEWRMTESQLVRWMADQKP